jgi:hypothetical protein
MGISFTSSKRLIPRRLCDYSGFWAGIFNEGLQFMMNVWMMLARVPSDPLIFEEFGNVASRKHQTQHLVPV